MNYLLRILIIHLISILLPIFLLSSRSASAYDHKIGGWELIKIIAISNQYGNKPLLKNGMRLESMSEQFTIWSDPPTNKKKGNLDIYCHPERMNGFEFKDNYTNDERLKPFLEKIGGISELNKILKNKFNFPLKKIDFVYETGANKDGKEPCKSIENTNFYMSKDMKYVFMFIYPYIYQFKGGFGYIDGSEYIY